MGDEENGWGGSSNCFKNSNIHIAGCFAFSAVGATWRTWSAVQWGYQLMGFRHPQIKVLRYTFKLMSTESSKADLVVGAGNFAAQCDD
jgi:hypothetical protein